MTSEFSMHLPYGRKSDKDEFTAEANDYDNFSILKLRLSQGANETEIALFINREEDARAIASAALRVEAQMIARRLRKEKEAEAERLQAEAEAKEAEAQREADEVLQEFDDLLPQ